MIESYLHQLSDDWGTTLFYWVHVTLSMCFFSKRYGYVTKSIHPFDMYDIPFPGSFPEFCEDDWDSESGTLPSGKLT